jgi:hypothetical protein
MFQLANKIFESAYTNGAAWRLQFYVLFLVILSIIDAIILAIGVLAVYIRMPTDLRKRLA